MSLVHRIRICHLSPFLPNLFLPIDCWSSDLWLITNHSVFHQDCAQGGGKNSTGTKGTQNQAPEKASMLYKLLSGQFKEELKIFLDLQDQFELTFIFSNIITSTSTSIIQLENVVHLATDGQQKYLELFIAKKKNKEAFASMEDDDSELGSQI